LRFIGKKYGDSDRVNGMFGSKWNEWWQNGWFDILEKHIDTSDKCAEKLKEKGIEIVPDEKGALWFFERYGCPRFTTPDDKGNIIIDICYFVK
jgi:hypothetical protein